MNKVNKYEATHGYIAIPATGEGWLGFCDGCHFLGKGLCIELSCKPSERRDGCYVIFEKDESCKRVNPLVYDILSSLKQARHELTLLGGKILETYGFLDLIDKTIAKVEALK